jgi:hypothetical protein
VCYAQKLFVYTKQHKETRGAGSHKRGSTLAASAEFLALRRDTSFLFFPSLFFFSPLEPYEACNSLSL